MEEESGSVDTHTQLQEETGSQTLDANSELNVEEEAGSQPLNADTELSEKEEAENQTVDTDTDSELNLLLQELKEWIESKDDFDGVTLDEELLVIFIRGCKFDLDKCKAKLKRYVQCKKKYPQWLANRDVTDQRFLEIYNTGLIYRLKNKTADSQAVILVDCKVIDQCKMSINDCIRLTKIVQDSDMFEGNEEGFVWVVDTTGIPLSFIFQMTPRQLYGFVEIFSLSVPQRMKGAYMLNVNGLFYATFKICLSFISAKMRSRIHVYGKSPLSMYEQVQLDCLPFEYGGHGGTIKENMDYFQEDLVRLKDKFMS